MSRLDLSRSLAVALLALALAGCQSTNGSAKGDHTGEPTKYDNPLIGPFEGDDLYAGVPSKMVQISDSDVVFANEKDTDYELIAKWATERRDVISWCLKEMVQEVNDVGQPENRYKRVWPDDPKRPQTRIDQAIAIGMRVVEKIPGNTRERVRLAWSIFYKGSNEYWAIDACMNRINVLKAKMGDDEANEKFPAEKKEIERLRKTAADASWRMLRYHKAALTHFNNYMSSMPMDKVPLDFIWKIHYQLGDFREAVRVMNLLLEEDMLKEEIKQEYLSIRKEINEYLVEREINKDAPKPGAIKVVKADTPKPGE